jgi:hypothetical protein
MFLNPNIKHSFTSVHSVTFLLRTSNPIPVLRIPGAVVLDYGASEMERIEKATREAPNHNKLEYISAMQ